MIKDASVYSGRGRVGHTQEALNGGASALTPRCQYRWVPLESLSFLRLRSVFDFWFRALQTRFSTRLGILSIAPKGSIPMPYNLSSSSLRTSSLRSIHVEA